jgi:hypothetical protein
MPKPLTKDPSFYLGNKNLPVAETQFEWTPEMVEDLERARKSILHFSKFFYIVNLDEGKQPIKLYTYQKRILKALVENRFNVVLASRQIGKTTILTIFALWMVCFQDDFRVLLIANKEGTAINIFKRIRLAYEMLPNYMKPGVVNYAKTGLELANGSSIGISTTTSDAARGESINCLLIDEAAFIPPEFMDDFWESVFPVISSSKKSKIFMLSTPNGVGNLFFNIYTDAVADKNGWHHERVDWFEVPGRDEKWKELTAKALGSVEAFNQEYGNEFRAAGENIFDKDQLDTMESNALDPVFVDDDNTLKVFKDRIDGHYYSIGVDVGEGIGRANSTIQIVDVTDLTQIEQVAIYANNKLDPFNFTAKLVEIALQWGSPPLLVERNNCGAQVIDALMHTHQYNNIVKYTPSMGTFTEKAESDTRMGVYSHTNSKFNSMSNFRYWMNVLRCVKLNDKDTINEFKTYIRQANGIWKKQSDKYLDDRVEALIWAVFILEPKVAEQFYEITQLDGNGKPLKIVPSNWDPFVVSMPKPSEMYNRFNKDKDADISLPRNPVFIPGAPEENSDLEELKAMGWHTPNFSGANRMLPGMNNSHTSPGFIGF